MISNVKVMGEKYGIKFGDLTFLSNSHNSLEAAKYAREKGVLHEYHERLMRAYFTELKDIGDIEVLLQLAEGLNLDKVDMEKAIVEKRYLEKLEKDAELAAEYGISSTPTFIINDKYMVVGAQDVSQFKRALREVIG
jgi:predicted DsbA family dithiol-disulfide isomerase